MQDFRKLKVWEKSHLFVLEIYRITVGFPNDERFGLTSQIRRSSASIPTNIAEGCGRGSDADFGRFLQMAMGSASEAEYQILLARDLQFLSPQEANSLTDQLTEVRKMLNSLIRSGRS